MLLLAQTSADEDKIPITLYNSIWLRCAKSITFSYVKRVVTHVRLQKSVHVHGECSFVYELIEIAAGEHKNLCLNIIYSELINIAFSS